MQQSQLHPSSLCPLLRQRPLKAARPATAATAMATAAVASPVKAASIAKAATRRPVKAVAHAATDAIAVADVVDVVVALTAKAAHSASVLTPKVNRCPWKQTCSPVVKPQAVTMAIGRNNALNALPASVVNAAAVVDVVVVSAMKPVNESNNRAQKAVPMRPKLKAARTHLAMKAKPAKAVVKAEKVAEKVVATAAVVAMDVVPARMARAVMPVVKTTSRPSSVSRRQTTAPLP